MFQSDQRKLTFWIWKQETLDQIGSVLKLIGTPSEVGGAKHWRSPQQVCEVDNQALTKQLQQALENRLKQTKMEERRAAVRLEKDNLKDIVLFHPHSLHNNVKVGTSKTPPIELVLFPVLKPIKLIPGRKPKDGSVWHLFFISMDNLEFKQQSFKPSSKSVLL